MSLKLISMWEPWSSLLAHSMKRIETRGWSTDFRGEVAIHSTKGGLSQEELFLTCADEPFRSLLADLGIFRPGMSCPQLARAFPRGQIIAVGTLVDCCPTESDICIPGVFDDHLDLNTEQERAFGDYSTGRYGLVFENVSMLQEPVSFKSRQGELLDLDFETEAKVRANLW